MGSAQDKKLIVGLDIGTSKVVAIVGEIGLDGSIEIVGIGSNPSKGMKKGVVVNIESTVQSIQRAVEEAELMAGCEIHSVYAGIAGSHVRSLNSHGIVAIRDKEVTQSDVERLAARVDELAAAVNKLLQARERLIGQLIDVNITKAFPHSLRACRATAPRARRRRPSTSTSPTTRAQDRSWRAHPRWRPRPSGRAADRVGARGASVARLCGRGFFPPVGRRARMGV